MFTSEDVKLAANFKMGTMPLWYRADSGQIRFDIRRGHVTELNQQLSRPLQTQKDVDQLKKQVRAYLKSVA
jgi:hypothetical protein